MRVFANFVLSLLFIGSLALYGPSSKVIKLTAANFDSQVIRSNQLWFVEFYAPWCGHCKNLAPAWEKVAAGLQGIVNVGAVDMTTDQSVGAPYNVQGFPTIKFFGANKRSPLDYNGGRSEQELLNYVLDQVRRVANERMGGRGGSSGGSSNYGGGGSCGGGNNFNAGGSCGGGNCGGGSCGGGGYQGGSGGGSSDDSDVVVLTDRDFDEKVLKSNDLWLVEFYAPWCGHCKRLEPEWNVAASKLRGEVKVAKVDATVEQGLAQRYGIRGYPTIKLFPPGKKSDSNIEDYSGQRDSSSIINWALERKAQLRPILKVEQLLDKDIFSQYCKEIRGICIIAFLPHILDSSASERNRYISLLEEISTNHRSKPFTFLWAQAGDQFDLEEAMSLGSGYPSVVAVSFSKKKYSILRGAFTKASVDSFITGLMTGGQTLYDIRGELPIKRAKRWDGKDAPRQTSDDEDTVEATEPKADEL
eukprot:TRINITY_DN4878_c0_g1_i1.p1 TRINITY_DN4878_c0_g1~~TRINITY_DN4878_c0_g1_i1.p1  ORF type:complete len:473 (-),score=108.72 TRINITY_DN4878_c0_g1_i1:113-1531(-)